MSEDWSCSISEEYTNSQLQEWGKIREYLSQGNQSPDPETKDSQKNLKQKDRNLMLFNACMMQNGWY
jgi:hypothetical protein